MSLPPFRGAPGKPATFSGSNGNKAMPPANLFGNMGAKEGGVYHVPANQMAGATQMDESVTGYTGNPRNSSGPVGNTGDANCFPGRC